MLYPVQALPRGRHRGRRSPLRGPDPAGRDNLDERWPQVRVLDVVPTEENPSEYIGLLKIEPA